MCSRRLLLVITTWLFFAYFYVCTGPKHLSGFSKKLETTKFLRTSSKQIFVLYMKSNVLLLVVILATATSLLHCLSMKVTIAVILHCFLTLQILEKSLRTLFETRDLSLVKKYVQRQCSKLMEGRASIQDFTFAKEYRGMKSYKPGACVPALELTR